MDHLGGRQKAAFAGNEKHATPIFLQHQREIMPGEASAADDVDLKYMMPVLVRDVGKVLGFIDTKIIDEDVGVGNGGDEGGGTFGGCRIGKDGINAAADLRSG